MATYVEPRQQVNVQSSSSTNQNLDLSMSRGNRFIPQEEFANIARQLRKYVLNNNELYELGYPYVNGSNDQSTNTFIFVKSHRPFNQTRENENEAEFVPAHLENSERSYHLKRTCVRCSRSFNVTTDGEYLTRERCNYHWGKEVCISRNEYKYNCCRRSNVSKGCTMSKLHVWNGYVGGHNGPLEGYVQTVIPPTNSSGIEHLVLALDCEMCYTADGLDVTKVTLVSPDGQVVYDSFVKPDKEIIDYNTRFSGITEDDFTDQRKFKSLKQVQNDLLSMICANTILIGHALNNDLRALKINHSQVIDTSILFHHHNGLPYRDGLKALANMYLNKEIQGNRSGHDCAEDARTSLQLVLCHLENKMEPQDLIKKNKKQFDRHPKTNSTNPKRNSNFNLNNHPSPVVNNTVNPVPKIDPNSYSNNSMFSGLPSNSTSNNHPSPVVNNTVNPVPKIYPYSYSNNSMFSGLPSNSTSNNHPSPVVNNTVNPLPKIDPNSYSNNSMFSGLPSNSTSNNHPSPVVNNTVYQLPKIDPNSYSNNSVFSGLHSNSTSNNHPSSVVNNTVYPLPKIDPNSYSNNSMFPGLPSNSTSNNHPSSVVNNTVYQLPKIDPNSYSNNSVFPGLPSNSTSNNHSFSVVNNTVYPLPAIDPNSYSNNFVFSRLHSNSTSNNYSFPVVNNTVYPLPEIDPNSYSNNYVFSGLPSNSTTYNYPFHVVNNTVYPLPIFDPNSYSNNSVVSGLHSNSTSNNYSHPVVNNTVFPSPEIVPYSNPNYFPIIIQNPNLNHSSNPTNFFTSRYH